MSELENRIHYTFKNKKLLHEALSHSSYANEGKRTRSNERLEFLGDSVLSIIVAKHLFTHYTHLPEGELTKLRASLVCEKSLHEFACDFGLGEFLLLGKGEELTGGRERPSIIADAFEALLAAIYLDGGMEQARKFVLQFIPEHLNPKQAKGLNDYKTTLQEIIQQNKEEKIEYVPIEETGPDHDKTFVVELHLNSNVIGTGRVKSEKQAEQFAAKEALELMGYETL